MRPRGSSNLDLSGPAARWGLGLVVLIAATVYLGAIGWGLPPDWLTWAGDEIRPGAVTGEAQWDPLYPPAHRYLLATLLEGLAAAGRLLSWQPENLRTFQTLAARGLTVFLATLALLAIYRGARLVLGRLESLLAVICVGFGTGYVFYGKTANLDIPYLFWFVVSVVFYLRCLRSRRLLDYLLFAAFGTLSITTKTQAWALYLLPSAALVIDLARAHSGRRWALARALVDRRILAAAAATVLLTLLLFGELWGRGELVAHYQAITAQPYEGYRAATATTRAVFGVSLENLVLSLGLPVLVCSLLGVLAALFHPRRNARLLHVLLFPLSYYPAFILATGFNYERHYLPITVVLGFFAGKALGAIWRSRHGPLWLRGGVVVAIVVHVLLRGVSVDLLLRGDARYEVERWLAAEGLYDRTAGLGSIRDLPRGLVSHPVSSFAKWRSGEHLTNPVVWHNCFVLNRLGAEYLIPDFAEKLIGPGVNYAEYRRFSNRARWSAVDFGRFSAYHTALAKLARDIVIFKRTNAECVDSGRVPRGLHELRAESAPDRRRSLAHGILESPASKARTLPRSDYRVVRTHSNFWTVGTFPAGVVVSNTGHRPYAPKLGLSLAGADADFPVTVSIEDGAGTRQEVFERPEVRRVALREVAPGDVGLYIVWTDTEWVGPGRRRLGVRLAAGETRGEWLNRLFEEQADLRLYERLSALSSSRDRHRRASFVESVIDGSIPNSSTVEDGTAVLVGGWPDGWTHGTRPAGLLIENPANHIVRPRLRLGCDPREGDPRLTVSIDDGSRVTEVILDCRRVTSVRLRKIDAGSRKLYILRSDRPSAATPQDDRLRGVLVRDVRLIEKDA